MWEGFNESATDEALGFQARNPLPPRPPKAGFWQQAGELLAAPLKGAGQGVQQTLRVGNRTGLIVPQAGNPLAMTATEQEQMLDAAGITRERIDQDLRTGIEALKPDPIASTAASAILQDASRLLTKVGAYSVAAGPFGAVVGTGLDEGVTGYMELRDKGVDEATAAKVGAVRGMSTAASVALPIAGRTAAQTAALVAGGGPGAFMAEQGLTREILENANYPELAAQHDPLDPAGLGVSLLFTGTVGAVAHRARTKAAAGEPAPAPRPAEVLADMPEVRDAAHVAYQARVIEQHMLGDRTDPKARAAHAEAIDSTARAMENGEPVRLAALDLEAGRATRLAGELMQRLRSADVELAAIRAAETPIPQAPMPTQAAAQIDTAPTLEPSLRIEPTLQPQSAATALQRAEEIVRERPDLPVRMDEADTPMAARDLLDDVRHDLANDKADASAFDAAITCFLRTGP